VHEVIIVPIISILMTASTILICVDKQVRRSVSLQPRLLVKAEQSDGRSLVRKLEP
jgi:hypothetical protein